MKVVISRKGFDSSYGGYPSPILPDGTLLSLPIPSHGDKIKYSDLKFIQELSFYDIMKQLKPKIKAPNRGAYQLSIRSECHLDPDLSTNLINRNDDWRPLFGQINQAQSHLTNEGISEGDLFLFFGWFKQTERKDGKLQFEKNAQDLHVIYGYLQIDKIINPNSSREVPKWMRYHPHAIISERRNNPTNTLYIAKKSLSWNKKINGGGMMKLGRNNILTKGNETRSVWLLPSFFKELNITYHNKNSWNKDGSFNSAKRGQEFVIEENRKVSAWAKSLINEYAIF